MTNLTAEDARQLASIFRALMESRKEIGILRILLVTYAKDGIGPTDWEQHFQQVKELDVAASFAKPFEPILQMLEEAAETLDLREVLSKMPPGTLPS